MLRAQAGKTRQVAELHPSGVVLDRPAKVTAREAMEAGCGAGGGGGSQKMKKTMTT